MTVFEEVDFDPNLTLKARGHEYLIEAPLALEGLRIWRFFSDPKATDIDHFREVVKLLGAVWDEDANTVTGGLWSQMEADGLSWPEIMRIGATGLLAFGRSAVAAAAYWGKTPTFATETAGGKFIPKPIAEETPAPAPRKTAAKKAPSRKRATTRKKG